MKEKIIRFMQGRYGVDDLSKFTMTAAMICVLLSVFASRVIILEAVFNTACFALIIYTYYRIFSKDISRRYAENQKYLEKTAGLRVRIAREKGYMEQRKTHHIYSCPQCKQKIRIPKGKGKIEIDCPKCHNKFIKRS